MFAGRQSSQSFPNSKIEKEKDIPFFCLLNYKILGILFNYSLLPFNVPSRGPGNFISPQQSCQTCSFVFKYTIPFLTMTYIDHVTIV